MAVKGKKQKLHLSIQCTSANHMSHCGYSLQIFEILPLILRIVLMIGIEIFELCEVLFLLQDFLQCWRVLTAAEPASLSIANMICQVCYPFFALFGDTQYFENPDFSMGTFAYLPESILIHLNC